VTVTDSILNTVKHTLNLLPEDHVFDQTVVLHINSTLSTLSQLGIGPSQGFRIDDEAANWVDFLSGDNRLNNVKSYVYLQVRLLFDPPGNSFAVTAIQEQIKELQWRINAAREDQQ
jgi:hypothetical protein